VGHWNRIRMGGSKSILSVFAAFCLLFSLLSTTLSSPVEAKTTRAAIIVEVSGTVTVKKAGGSKSYTAYGDMTLNQGDVISTGSASSVVVRIADHDDEVTIGDNAEVSVTDLANEGNGKQSKISSWAGSMWVKVKSLVSSEDEFEVETPTAVMGVRGTQFFMGVNPLTGDTYVTVAAGAVNTKTVTPSDDSNEKHKQNEALLMPSQQISLTERNELNDLNTKVSVVDIFTLVEKSSVKLLEAIIKNKAEIDKENKEFIDKKSAELIEKNKTDNGISTLTIKDVAELNKVSKNLDNIVGNIAKAALEQNKIDRARLSELINLANEKISDPLKKLDLDKVEKLDPTAGVDPELEKKKQEELLKLNAEVQRKLAEKAKLEQAMLAKYQTLLDAVEKEKKRVQEENKKVEADALKKAEEEYTRQLSDTEKKKFAENKNSNNSSTTTPTTSSGSTSGSTSGTTSGTTASSNNNVSLPPAPVVADPAQETINTTGKVQLKATGVLNSNILIYNGDTVLATLPGQGDSQVTFDLTFPDGVYNLTARTERFGRYSAAVAIPKITVGIPEVSINQQSGISNNKASLELKMKNFIDVNQFYALEAHLVYNNASFKYSGDTTLTDVSGTVFDGSQMAETLNPKMGSTQSELIYAASQFETTGGATVNNISLGGEKLLVTIPLDIINTNIDTAKVDLVYVKIVNKSGQTVYEMGSGKPVAPKSIDVKTK
jgi:hypothetical protein